MSGEGLVIILLQHHSFQCHTLIYVYNFLRVLISQLIYFCFISVIKNYRYESYIKYVYWDTLQSVLDNPFTLETILLYRKKQFLFYEIKHTY